MSATSTRFSAKASFDLPAPETRGNSNAAVTGSATVYSLVGCIALADLIWPKTNLAVLYVVPLMLLAASDGLRPWWRSVGLLVFLTYAIYFLKYAITQVLGFDLVSQQVRLANRTLVAASIVGIAYMLSLWNRWALDQSDPEVPSSVQMQDRELSATLAGICCVPLVILIWILDFMAPANYNVAILYAIPLFICVWLQSRLVLWTLLVLLLALSATAYLWGPPPDVDVSMDILTRNRLISSGGLVVLTTLLSRQILPKMRES